MDEWINNGCCFKAGMRLVGVEKRNRMGVSKKRESVNDR